MEDLGAFAKHFGAIQEEYGRNKGDPLVSQMWMDWDSDWDHRADWQVLPIFVSETILRARYGEEANWPEVSRILSQSWPRISSLVSGFFENVSLVAFSRLRANQELRPHLHENAGHRIFHMGMDIPSGDVGISTSSGTHKWENPGEWIVFDDTKTHSAWNRSEEDRVIFYVDFITGH